MLVGSNTAQGDQTAHPRDMCDSETLSVCGHVKRPALRSRSVTQGQKMSSEFIFKGNMCIATVHFWHKALINYKLKVNQENSKNNAQEKLGKAI